VRELETRLTPSLIALASFSTTDGQQPSGQLVIDSSGDIFGTCAKGGLNRSGGGTIFEFVHSSGQLNKVAQFGKGAGYFPVGGLVADSSGNLYGTAPGGGASRDGTVYELNHATGALTALAAFNGTDGAFPYSGVIMDGSGDLFGTTYAGGGSKDGTVFEVAHGFGMIITLASFNGTDGANPEAGLVMDASGNLYGTTFNGGTSGDGTVFEVAQGSGTVTTLASFNGTDGSFPTVKLVMDGSGNLYGATQQGGASGFGTVFELAHGSSTITTLASFNGTNGGGPSALLMDSSGNLYGTTPGGGAHHAGTIFEVAADSGTITTLASFDGPGDGKYPSGLTVDGSGNLYGVTLMGGANKDGTVFELPGGAVPTDQWTGANFAVDTNWSDGANWSLGAPPTPSQVAVFTNNSTVKDFTSTLDAGFTNAIGGLKIDSTWGGTITVKSPLAVTGNMTLASGSCGGSGAVTIGGSDSQWTGGQIIVGSGGFTNTGTLNADTTGGDLVVTGAGTLTNDGQIYEAGINSLILKRTATLSNAGGATFDITDNGGVGQSGGGSFTNAGTLEKTQGTGISTIATSTLNNTGTVEATSGILDIAATVAQVSGKTLTGGTWKVIGSATVHAKLDITSAGRFTTVGSGAKVTLSGTTVAFPNLTSLATIDKGASLSLLHSQSRTTVGALTNKGSLVLGPGSTLTVSGSFTQTSTGSLTTEVGGPKSAPTFGQVFSTTGTVSLAGSLDATSTVVPAVGDSFTILENKGNSAIRGSFAGLAEGATFTVTEGTTTMTFQITYVGPGTFGDNNVIITRIS
jgi:uncharacterized repeat protein (TIGR03803 family)